MGAMSATGEARARRVQNEWVGRHDAGEGVGEPRRVRITTTTRPWRTLAACACLALVAAPVPAATRLAWTASLQRVSVDSSGVPGNHRSRAPAISADGRFVAFESLASNLVAGDVNGASDVFVHDRRNGQTTRVSVAPGGAGGDGASEGASISDDGRFVAFSSTATNLVPNDTNGVGDVFVRDLVLGTTRRVSVASAGSPSSGTQSDGPSSSAAISPDGRFVVFASAATNLVPLDTNTAYDVFRHDVRAGTTSRVSVGAGGAQSNGGSYAPAVSRDGGRVAFGSAASNLAPFDANAVDDVFVHDVSTGHTRLVSADPSGAAGDRVSFRPALSSDGRFVAFASDATTLVAGDTNDVTDVFVRDLTSNLTHALRVDANGTPADGPSVSPRLSRDGRFVVFASLGANWVPGDTNGAYDVFVHDRAPGASPPTIRVSVATNGAEAHGASVDGAISGDGRRVAFDASASDLVPNDTNGFVDVFVADL